MKKFILLFLLSTKLMAKIDFSGHNQTNAFIINTSDKISGLLHQFRLNGKSRFSEQDSLNFALELNALVLNKENFPSSSLTQSTFYRFETLKELKAGSNAYLLPNLDRLSLNKDFSFFDITVGRQALSYGNLNSISPINIFLAKPISAFNYEYTPGLDAIRAVFPLDETSEIEFAHIFSKKNKLTEDPSLFKIKFPTKEISHELVLFHYSHNQMLGLSSQFFVNNLEFLSDFSYTFRKNYFNFFRGSWALTYYFNPNSIAKLEYHYNTPESEENRNIDDIKLYDYTRFYLRKKHYFHLNWQKTFENLNSFSMVHKFVPEDKLWQVMASFVYNRTSDLSLYVSGSIPLAQETEGEIREFSTFVVSVKKYC